ncbi:MAG: hypothetical protein SBU_000290 [Candidatus Syntrophoarchaeum butanivorans]|uniref:Uncharacterized protein n=1 Tax=Candidatus Syntropharchaeum butanivorans TaxID=1839936 RepID=A0A1F2P6P2_9EURY|nr:MAG: hypothetical protein SBU_000290 [Candidatus Syntrophoarchaeum butanivorans]
MRIGFINTLHWISSKDCRRRSNEYIFPEYMEPVAV